MSSPSVIVVGAGIVGCTVAYELARTGARVEVLETRALGQGATRASAGILAPYIEGHEDIFRDLGARSLEMYDGFIARLREESGHDIPYQRNGTLELAFDDGGVQRLAALASALGKQGVEARWLTPDVFERLEPLASRQSKGGLVVPIHGFVGVTSLTMAAAAAAERFGAQFKAEVGALRIHPLPGGRVGVEAAASKWEADRVVLAAGSWSQHITVQDADTVPVKPIRGQLIQLRAEPGAIRRVLWGPNGYLVPWPDGTVLVGSTVEDVGFDERHTDEAVSALRHAAAELVPSLAGAPITDVRTGLRPRGPDDLPMLGRSTAVPGLIYATAHYRNGVMFTPLTVELVRDLVFDRADDPALRDLDPSRHGKL
ncbi:MAG TPA: glycine oxidase ThiO [Vicinamibacterales bacterium]|nr:glycine oxidase ThiO [Vicinamibacterales bacterium]